MPIIRDGRVAMVNRRPMERTETLPNGHVYVFKYHRDVCLAWVLPEDVEAIFDIKQSCCGGRLSSVFNYATEGQAGVWLTP